MPIRFFKYLVFLAWWLVSSSPSAFSEDGGDDFFLRGLLKQQQSIMEKNHQLPDWLRKEPIKLDPEFESILKKQPPPLNGSADSADHTNPEPTRRWVFVSFSLPDAELKAAALEAAETGAALVFRGIAEHENTSQFALRVANVVKGIKPTPGTVIDPTLFARWHIKAVPAMAFEGNGLPNKIVYGLPGFAWLERQEAGYLGHKGATYPIAEPDMIEEIKRRIMSTDWEKQKREALNQFWARQARGIVLPTAQQHRRRSFDPSLVVTDDIRHPDGRIILRKGQTLNPQTVLPMRQAYIIFDATSKAQTQLAKHLGESFREKGKPIVYLYARMDTREGWQAFNTLNDRLSAPTYPLNDALVNRFQIQALPTSIEGQGDRLLIQEYPCAD